MRHVETYICAGIYHKAKRTTLSPFQHGVVVCDKMLEVDVDPMRLLHVTASVFYIKFPPISVKIA